MPDTALSMLVAGGSLLQFGETGLAIAETLVAAVVLYFVYVLLTLVFGGFVVLVAGERVRRLDRRIRHSPLRAGGFGAVALLASLAGFVLVGVVVILLVERGAPEPLALLLILPFLAGSLAVLVVSAVGELIAGSWLLRTVKQQPEPSLWAALAVGAVFVNMAYLVPGLNLLVGLAMLALPIGGLLDGWWGRR